jgi:hypothetical protein
MTLKSWNKKLTKKRKLLNKFKKKRPNLKMRNKEWRKNYNKSEPRFKKPNKKFNK